jgi:hypothetical protein
MRGKKRKGNRLNEIQGIIKKEKVAGERPCIQRKNKIFEKSQQN